MDTETRTGILKEAKSWLNTPFHHKGRIKGVGVDCGGFIYEVYKTILPLSPFPKFYAEDWALHNKTDEIYLDSIKPYICEIIKAEPADVIVWQYARAFSHGTIYLGNNRYIHAWGRSTQGCVQISQENFFHIGFKGKRPRKIFTIDERWLNE